MTRLLWLLFLFPLMSGAQQPSAREVLAKMHAAYTTVGALHVIVERQETLYRNGRPVTGTSECELAIGKGRRYFARLKQGDQDAISVSDGDVTWKALPSRRQWTKESATAAVSPEEEDTDDKDPGARHGRDLRGTMEQILIGQYLALARLAEDAVIAKEENFKLGREKVPCYLIRSHAGGEQHEALVDKQRFLVLQYRQKGDTPEGPAEIVVKTRVMEVNQEVPDSLFHFEPPPKWTEAEMLVLPGDERLILTGLHAAPFALKTLNGEPVALAEMRGKVVVLDFWATWCPPCRAELPSIEKLRADFGNAVQFYGVNDEESGTVKKFVKEHHYQMPVLMDDKRTVHRLYGVEAIPTFLVIGRDNVIRQHFIGSRSDTVLRKAIQSAVDSN